MALLESPLHVPDGVDEATAAPTLTLVADRSDASVEPSAAAAPAVRELFVQDPQPWDRLDSSYFATVAKGIVAGILVLFVYMAIIMKVAMPDMPMWPLIGGAFFIAMWPGALGGVVGVGIWSQKHHKELFGDH